MDPALHTHRKLNMQPEMQGRLTGLIGVLTKLMPKESKFSLWLIQFVDFVAQVAGKAHCDTMDRCSLWGSFIRSLSGAQLSERPLSLALSKAPGGGRFYSGFSPTT